MAKKSCCGMVINMLPTITGVRIVVSSSPGYRRTSLRVPFDHLHE
jgi:hypothetical protein